MACALQFEAVSKRYRSFLSHREIWALREFSLAIEPGEIVGFLGPNGAGKTTAIHIALGITKATSGNGKLLGKPFGDVHTRRSIGFLAESPAFYHRSAKTILKLCGALNGIRDPELSSRAVELLEQVGLGDEADRSVGKFSRGMLQRVGIAQALMNDPDLLILDEPTSALDPISRHQVRELLRSARQRGKAVFLSSHQLSEVEMICDRVFFVNKGTIVAAGRTHELLASKDEFEIVAAGFAAAPAYGRDVSVDANQIRFTVAAKDQEAAIQDVWSQRGTLISVTPKTRSLEEMFLELVTKDASPCHSESAQRTRNPYPISHHEGRDSSSAEADSE